MAASISSTPQPRGSSLSRLGSGKENTVAALLNGVVEATAGLRKIGAMRRSSHLAGTTVSVLSRTK